MFDVFYPHFSILFQSRNLIDFWMAFLMDFDQQWSQSGSQKLITRTTFLASKSDTFPQGVLCKSPWLVLAFLAPFWSLLAPFRLHFGSFWLHYWACWLHFPSKTIPFGARIRRTPADNRRHPHRRNFSSQGHMRNFAEGNLD